MDVKLDWIDVTENLETGEQPVHVFKRPLLGGRQDERNGVFASAKVSREGVFWVPQSPLIDQPVTWNKTTSGEFVRVPLHAYRTSHAALASVFAVGVELGVRAVASLAARGVSMPARELRLVVGHEAHEKQDAYRVYLGLAVRTE